MRSVCHCITHTDKERVRDRQSMSQTFVRANLSDCPQQGYSCVPPVCGMLRCWNNQEPCPCREQHVGTWSCERHAEQASGRPGALTPASVCAVRNPTVLGLQQYSCLLFFIFCFCFWGFVCLFVCLLVC